jgi:hypothetical protein
MVVLNWREGGKGKEVAVWCRNVCERDNRTQRKGGRKEEQEKKLVNGRRNRGEMQMESRHRNEMERRR